MIQLVIYFFVLTIALCQPGHSLQNPFKPGSALVRIGTQTKTLTRSTSCQPKTWGNNQESACRCCIIKYGLRDKGRFVYDGNHIPYCLNKKHCTREIIDDIATSLATSYNPEYPSFLVTKIINDAIVTPTVGTLNTEQKAKDRLTPENIKKALKILMEQKKLPGDPRDINCYRAEELPGRGKQTLQLFMVSKNAGCGKASSGERFEGMYVIKEPAKGSVEIRNLREVEQSPLGQYNLNNKNRPVGFPAIAFDEISFSYKTNGNLSYLSVLTLAPGDSVFNILRKFSEVYKKNKENPTLESESYRNALVRAQHAMMNLGSQIGRLHARYMTRDKNNRLTGRSSAVHGDLHANNVFSDLEQNIVLIDPETFVISLKNPRDVGKDILRLYLFSTVRDALHQNVRKGNVGQTYWHNMIIKPFLREYIRSYALLDGRFNQDNFNDVMRILRKTFSLSGGGADIEAFLLKAGPFKSLWAYRKYIKKILTEVEMELKNNPKAGGLNQVQELILKGNRSRTVRGES